MTLTVCQLLKGYIMSRSVETACIVHLYLYFCEVSFDGFLLISWLYQAFLVNRKKFNITYCFNNYHLILIIKRRIHPRGCCIRTIVFFYYFDWKNRLDKTLYGNHTRELRDPSNTSGKQHSTKLQQYNHSTFVLECTDERRAARYVLIYRLTKAFIWLTV